MLDSVLPQLQLEGGLLYVRDDGSTDGTEALLSAYSSHPCLVLLHDQLGNLGVIGSFELLLQSVEADYYILADQDDYWLPGKLASLLALIRRAEVAVGGGAALVYSDLQVVDESGHEISPSFWALQNLDPRWPECLENVALQNVVPGCSMLFNRALRDLALPFPFETVMHDWWLLLVAAAHGSTAFLSEPCQAYRIHGTNTVGLHGGRTFWNRYRFGLLLENLRRALEQLAALFRRWPDLSGRFKKASTLARFAELDCRQAVNVALRVQKRGVVRQYATRFALMLMALGCVRN